MEEGNKLKKVGFLNQVINEHAKALSLARDEEIKKQLHNHGFTFKDNQELMNFAKTRMRIVQENQNIGINKLYVIRKHEPDLFIFEWNTAPVVEFKDNNIFVTL